MDFNLSIGARVISGENCVLNGGAELKKLGSSCLIVTGKTSAQKSGALSDVISVLEKEGMDYKVFSEIGPNPLLSACKKAGDEAREMGADFIIGIGGGSPLDAAKAAAIFASNEDLGETDIYTVKERNRALPLVFIGTTAGTGSEVGKVSVLTDGNTGRKKSIAPYDVYGTLTFADPKYTYSVSLYQTVSTALDALSHALEGYFSPMCSDIPKMFALKAIPMIWSGLCEISKSKGLPSKETRDTLYYGSLWAGITLDYCGTAFPHPLGYVLTENYGLSHGMACAAFMDDFLDRCEKYESEKLKTVLKLLGTTKDGMKNLIVSLRDTENIKMTEEEIKTYVSRWDNAEPGNFKKSPGGYTKKEAKAAFRKFIKQGEQQ